MSDPLFVLHLGGSTYVDVRGVVTSSPPTGAVVLPKPAELRLNAAAMAAALRDLADPELDADEFAERWVQAGQNDQLAQWMFKSAEVATIIGGVLLSVSQPPGLVAAVILGIIISAFAADDGLDEEVAAELQRIRWQLQAQADIQ